MTRAPGWSLICPACQALLVNQGDHYHCPPCGKSYPVESGVVRFVPADPFYEQKYAPETLKFNPDPATIWGKAALYWVGMHYFWFLRRYIPQGAKILDLAGGAGMEILASCGEVAGLDVSMRSTTQMAKVYSLAMQADAFCIPLADQSLDVIVSRFFFEHIHLEKKPALLRECWRVLRPGGLLISLQDCEADNPLWLWAKQDEALFAREFIAHDGHYGLCYASENLKMFTQTGFEVVRQYAANKTVLVTPSMLAWMQPYRGKSWPAKILLGIGGQINHSRIPNMLYSVGMTMVDDCVERWLPLDHARYLLAVCRRV